MATSKFTHKELVKIGSHWLQTRYKCKVVVMEMIVPGVKEIPDVIGWKLPRGHSVLIECKISKNDFLNDQNKITRKKEDFALGIERYYLVPKGLIKVEELPKDWGLLYATGRGVQIIKKAVAKRSMLERYAKNELPMLISLVQRAQLRGFDVNCKATDLKH